MAYEIIYVCNSTNNKNVREGELEILRKKEDQLYFEFGESEMNVKKRFYNDLETLNKDFEALTKLKNKVVEEPVEKKEVVEKKTEKVTKKVAEPVKKSYRRVIDDED